MLAVGVEAESHKMLECFRKLALFAVTFPLSTTIKENCFLPSILSEEIIWIQDWQSPHTAHNMERKGRPRSACLRLKWVKADETWRRAGKEANVWPDDKFFPQSLQTSTHLSTQNGKPFNLDWISFEFPLEILSMTGQKKLKNNNEY